MFGIPNLTVILQPALLVRNSERMTEWRPVLQLQPLSPPLSRCFAAVSLLPHARPLRHVSADTAALTSLNWMRVTLRSLEPTSRKSLSTNSRLEAVAVQTSASSGFRDPFWPTRNRTSRIRREHAAVLGRGKVVFATAGNAAERDDWSPPPS